MKRWIWSGLLLAMTFAAMAGDNGVQKHRLDATVHVGAVDLGPARFELACSGKGGYLALTLILMKPDEVKNFPLNDFEGPDGVGGSRELAEWSVDTRGPSFNYKTGIGGWYGVDGDGFVLSSNGDSGKSPITAFVHQLVDAKSQRLRLNLSAPRQGDPLQAEVMLAGAQAELARTAADCLGQ